MKVRLTVHRPDIGKQPGDVIDVEPIRATQLIQAGQAEAVKVEAETAVVPPAAEAAVTTTTPATGRNKKGS